MWEQFVTLVDGGKIQAIVVMILVNVILGIAVSIKQGRFNLKAVGDFLRSRVVPYVLGYYAIGLVGLVDPKFAVIVTVAFAAVVATLTGAILQSLKELGLPVPDVLSGKS